MVRQLVMIGCIAGTMVVVGCDGASAPPDVEGVPDVTAHELSSGDSPSGKTLFERPFHGSNGRSCATCHVLAEHGVLTPANVRARLRANPSDPLFNRLDADDPGAPAPTYQHLQKGLIRVVLPLPDNMDLIDVNGAVVTPPERTISVWRAVPTIENTALTAPFQYDGRAATLQAQAQGAVTTHSQGPVVASELLDRIALFERSTFSSSRPEFVARLLGLGVPLGNIPSPESFLALSPQEARGQALFHQACEVCHGGATVNHIINRDVHDLLFLAVKPDGNVQFTSGPDGKPVPVPIARPHDEFINIGFGLASYLGQFIQFPNVFNETVSLPHYRFRFYSDATRSCRVTDLPPLPVTASGSPTDLTPAVDANGAPIVGPNFFPQWFSTDGGRALITGDPADFEAFDVPQLRGVGKTAPYMHDNSMETLKDVVDAYSRFILPAIPMVNLPPVNPPEAPGSPPEALTPVQKQDLVSYLNRL